LDAQSQLAIVEISKLKKKLKDVKDKARVALEEANQRIVELTDLNS
jgi:hypothetical protein